MIPTRLLNGLSLALLTLITPTVTLADPARTGAMTELSTLAHQVSGTATIVSTNAIRIDDFTYDGGGPAVYFYLGTNNTQQAFVHGIPIGGLLTGQVFSGNTVTVTLPAGQTLDGYNAISVWCVDFAANFGSGNFQPYISEIHSGESAVVVSVSGAPGEAYQLQGSSNGVSWINLTTKTNLTGTVEFTDTNALSARLYRLEVD